ncbi:hypothetical protein [uncultured Bartonella sp.]|nr:hypothetical protein [uncultured Bartonella sp.]
MAAFYERCTHSYLECMKDPQIEHVLKRDGAAVLANRTSWPSQVS